MVEGTAKVVKYVMVFTSIAIMILGAMMAGFGARKLSEDPNLENRKLHMNTLIRVASFIIVTSILGTCGAFAEQKWMLIIFTIFMTIILLEMSLLVLPVLVAAISLKHGALDKDDEFFRKTFKENIKNYAYNADAKKDADKIQNILKCCGITDDIATISWHSWGIYNTREFGGKTKVPYSCCKDGEQLIQCTENPTNSNAYLEDCLQKAREAMRQFGSIIIKLVAIIIGPVVLTIVLSCYLCCNIKKESRSSHYKEGDSSIE